MEEVTVTSKGQVTIPAKVRKTLGVDSGTRLMVVQEGQTIRMIPVVKLSKLVGVDRELFKGRRPSREMETVRNEWDKEFERRIEKD